jgi:hypothetical protein
MCWCDHLSAAGSDNLTVRAGVPPQHLALYWQMLPEAARAAGTWFVDVASGLFFVRLSVDDVRSCAKHWVDQIHQPALALRGYATVQAGAVPPLAASDVRLR